MNGTGRRPFSYKYTTIHIITMTLILTRYVSLSIVVCSCVWGSVYVATLTEHGLNHPRNLHHKPGTSENTGAHISRSRSQSSIVVAPLAAKRENSENYVPRVKPYPARDSFLRRSMPRSASASTENKLTEHRSRS